MFVNLGLFLYSLLSGRNRYKVTSIQIYNLMAQCKTSYNDFYTKEHAVEQGLDSRIYKTKNDFNALHKNCESCEDFY